MAGTKPPVLGPSVRLSSVARRLQPILRPIRKTIGFLSLPSSAKAERRRDSFGLPASDPGIDRAVDEGVAWLFRAQDYSKSADGGVARHYSLINGWSTSYPETTGYIIPTVLTYAKLRGDDSARARAKRMLDWLVSLQFPSGGFQGGAIGSKLVVPVTFNTGQILLGLAAGVAEFRQYRKAMCRAADWLVKTQDSDGCWRKHPTPFAAPGEKAYETHVAWGLFEAGQVEPDVSYRRAASANVRWALRLQHENGWFDKCCLTEPAKPLTHTLGYVLRGIIEAYRFTQDEVFLKAAQKTADGLMSAIRQDGSLPGRLLPNWSGAVSWTCLTGNVQVAYCWLTLYQYTNDNRYREAAFAANAYVRRTMRIDDPLETRGAIKGSFPVSGDYGRYQYLNWACKFFVDSNMLEKEIRDQAQNETHPAINIPPAN